MRRARVSSIPPASGDGRRSFEGTDRFELIRRLGEGGYGAVFEAHDHVRDQRVAIKVLTRVGADHVLRFKQEFRALADLEHPNLVQLGELFEDNGRWFFTMELVKGIDLIEYVRGSMRALGAADNDTGHVADARTSDIRALPFHSVRLRRSLIQLVDGVIALHRAGKVHRDIKPSNILVTDEGRVVLLDFGLVTSVETRQTTEALAVGTAAYMAPEQATGVAVGPAADWYGVGVVLYEALTGRLPFAGTAFEMLLSKQSSEPPPPRILIPDAPVDLSALCVGLLKPDPQLRLSGDEVRRIALGTAPESEFVRVKHATTALTRGVPFIGREAEQLRLRRVFDEVGRSGQIGIVYVHGESGVGKTALAAEFTESVEADHEDAVVLRGRCYERETVPYKAFDGVVDSLTRFLRSLTDAQCATFLPRRAQALPLVFPVLGRIKAITMQAGPRFTDIDRATLRSSALSALRELFERIAEKRPLILVIDDLQWADSESLALLLELSRPPETPRLMLILTARDPSECPLEVRQVIERLLAQVGARDAVRLEGLPMGDAERLARVLLSAGESTTAVDPAQIAREAYGHPLFMDALVRYSQQVTLTDGARPELDDALRFRIGQLEPEARRALELIALAAAPLPQKIVADAAGWPTVRAGSVVAKLRVLKLVRTSRSRQIDTVETFHDRIRQATVSRLSESERKKQHRQLAEAIEASDLIDVEAAAFHWREAGVIDKASMFALRAADRAMDNLAFDKAARLYREVAELDPVRRPQVKVKLADALSNAGRGQEAAAAYLAALDTAAPEQRNELRRRAAQQLLGSGNVDAGLAVARELLAAIDVKLPRTERGKLFALLYHRARLAMRGTNYKERDSTEVPEEELSRVDTLWAVAAIGMVDHVCGADLQTLHLLWALDTGEPYRIARALAMEAWLLASAPSTKDDRERTTDHAMALAEKCQHPHALGLTHLATGVDAYNRGDFLSSRDSCDAAEAILRERCTGVTWEITNARLFGALGAVYCGDFNDLRRRMLGPLRESKERGDLYAYANYTAAIGYLLAIADGDAELAAREVEDAMSRWSQQGFHVQHFLALLARIQIQMCMGNAKEAARHADERWPALERSQLLRAQSVNLYTRWFRGRAYAVYALREPARRKELLKGILSDASAIQKMPGSLANAVAALMRTYVCYVRGDRVGTVAGLEQSLAFTNERSLLAWSGASELALADLANDAARRDRALRQARELGIRVPRMLLKLYWPFDGADPADAFPSSV
jgi:tetratricopeptide (TPR) repeat protein